MLIVIRFLIYRSGIVIKCSINLTEIIFALFQMVYTDLYWNASIGTHVHFFSNNMPKYVYWDEGQPNLEDGKCVVMQPNTKWKSAPCNSTAGAACQYKPIPSTILI